MDDLKKILTNLNISDKEAGLYLANLETGPATGYQLAKQAKIKQPTVYALIDDLKRKGFITTREEKGKLMCVPIPPRQIVSSWKGKVDALEAFTPDLNALYEKSKEKPRVMIFEGVKGVNAVYNSIMSPVGTGKDEILVFASIPEILKSYHHLLAPWAKMVRDKRNRIRDIVGGDDVSVKYAKDMLAMNNPKYEVRTTNTPFGATDMIIFRNKVLVISHGQTLFATVTESEEIAKTYKVLFDALWGNTNQVDFGGV